MDPRDTLAIMVNVLIHRKIVGPPGREETQAQVLRQAVDDLLPSISESEARLIAEALEAAYQLGRLHP